MFPFDTLKYVTTLEQGGIERKLAEEYARALASLLKQSISHSNNPQNIRFLFLSMLKN
ncbi:MAG: hypothetical protein JO131_07620 [Gammaproteobacteria bacterium]|nr:hypothetical protein [Gammaproteobacteria bacterium]